MSNAGFIPPHSYAQDFETPIKELLISQKIHTRKKNPTYSELAKKTIWEGYTLEYTVENMRSIADHLGFKLHLSQAFYFIRDHFFRLPNGEVRTLRLSRYTDAAVAQVHSSNLYLDQTAATRTKNQMFNGWIGRTSSEAFKALKDSQAHFKMHPKPFSYSNIEGGNVWTAANSQEKVKILLGEDQFRLSLLTLILENPSWESLAAETLHLSSFNALKHQIDSSATPEALRHTAEEMFSLGLYTQKGRSGLIDRDSQALIMVKKFYESPSNISALEKYWFRNEAILKDLISPFQWSEEEAQNSHDAILDYLTKKNLMHRLIALDFGIDPDDLHLIVQAGYHLDVFMRPGPDHSFFITDYGLCTEMLQAIQKSADFCHLTNIDKEHLQRYIETAQKFHLELGPLLNQAAQQAKEAGFSIIPTPGSFLYETPTMYQEFPMVCEGFNINFINGLSGWSPKTKRPYYITHGLQVGNMLGSCIMDAFTKFLQSHIPDIEVFFIGRNPENINDFSEAMDWWNRIDTQSGIHCLTFEL